MFDLRGIMLKIDGTLLDFNTMLAGRVCSTCEGYSDVNRLLKTLCDHCQCFACMLKRHLYMFF